MNEYKVIGIDLAKTNFHLVALNAEGQKVHSARLHRSEVFLHITKTFTTDTLIAMEACGGCHYWGQLFEKEGYKVILLKPKDVKPYAKARQKNDINDALAIAKAALDPELKHVHIKTKEEQTIAFLHKIRQNVIQQRIALSNGLLTSLLEFGYTPNVGKAAFAKSAASFINEAFTQSYFEEEVLSCLLKDANDIIGLLEKEKTFDQRIKAHVKASYKAKRLLDIPGIGPINASILSIQPIASYETSSDFSASLGLVPRQFTTGGKIQLGSITKQGNRYVRTMLIQGARSIVMRLAKDDCPTDPIYVFAKRLRETKPYNVVCVAVANKLARVVHALITQEKEYSIVS
jgi:transposase